jgi:hypothetical protein
MNMKPFAAAAGFLCLAAASAGAQVVAEFREQAAMIRQDAAYAKRIECSHIPEAAEMGDSLRVYTRLDGVGPRESLPEEGKGAARVSSKASPKDETRLDDYGSQSVTREKLHVDAWSCDTQDYFMTFDLDGLVRSSQKTTSQPVKGHARVETRGQVDFEGDLSCTAFW